MIAPYNALISIKYYQYISTEGNIISRYLVILIIIGFIIFGGVYASVLPPFEAADEGAHFLYTHNLLETGELPVIQAREIVSAQAELTQQWAIETHQPPLYYALGAILTFWTDRDDIDDYLRTNDLIFVRGVTEANHNQWLHNPTRGEAGDTGLALSILRGFSMVLGGFTLYFVYLVSRIMFIRLDIPHAPLLAIAPILLVASIPTFVSISSSYNNDNLVTTLYAGGVYWCVRMWHRREINTVDIGVVSLILAMIALTKINGLSLFGIVYLSLFVGVWRGHYSRQSALRLFGISLTIAMLLAGWWYVRNWDLYGDPLALEATQSLWSREFEIAETSGDFGAELGRIYRSFWFMIGYLHLPLYGVNGLYIYAGVLSLVGIVGVGGWMFRRNNNQSNDIIGLLMLVCLTISTTLLIGTRSVDISYGRLLFPALIGFAPIMILGIYHIICQIFFMLQKSLKRFVLRSKSESPLSQRSVRQRGFRGEGIVIILLILPLTITAIVTPFTRLPNAYPSLSEVDSLPESANVINVDAEGLQIVAVDVQTDVLRPNQDLVFDLYLQGNHPDNPFLLVTIVDAITLERLGHVELFPSLAPTDSLDTDMLYRAEIRVNADEIDKALSPRQVNLQLAWHSLETFRDIPLTDGENTPIETLLVTASTLIDSEYQPESPTINTNVIYGDVIGLEGYTLSDDNLRAGDTLDIDLFWRYLNPMDEDWTVALQLISDAGEVIVQGDGMPNGYVTSAWRERDSIYVDRRSMTLPEDISNGEYHLYVGWYRASDFTRLPAIGDTVNADLAILPTTIHVNNR